MAKLKLKEQEVRTEEHKNVVTTTAGVPAHLAKYAEQDANKGLSSDAADNIVPLVYVLQGLSPQVNARDPSYIEGAEPGCILLKLSPHPVVDGEEGFVFQPCYFSKAWVRWKPRAAGGGYQGRFAELPKEAVERPDPVDPSRMKWYMPNGDEVIETRYHAGYVIMPEGAMPYVIPFSSTGHTASKNWMTMMRSPANNGQPAFAKYYLLKTRERSNAKGKWYVLDMEDAGWAPTEADYLRGKALYEAFEAGAKVFEAEETVATEGDGGDNARM